MNATERIKNILASENIGMINLSAPYRDELYITVAGADFVKTCNVLHKRLDCAVMMLFAEDLRAVTPGVFAVYCCFLSIQTH
ncbi:MAG: hypothetical protein PHV48_08135, partial [Candidatus Omnitrophica bacterium]|nr:hypothetical protein [Candidatus Omnitrophota bacterium]